MLIIIYSQYVVVFNMGAQTSALTFICKNSVTLDFFTPFVSDLFTAAAEGFGDKPSLVFYFTREADTLERIISIRLKSNYSSDYFYK